MNSIYSEYDVEYISTVMNLRIPQKRSLQILHEVLTSLKQKGLFKKGLDLQSSLEDIKSKHKMCQDFERDFISLAFSLATGAGKSKLMGAFIAYLYTNHDIKNFFILAPNTTIFKQLRDALVNSNSQKYLFSGLGCFVHSPEVVSEEDYRHRRIDSSGTGVRIFIYNIDKINKQKAKMRQLNENLGKSFYDFLSDIDDLVMLMDESHHYRADAGMKAIDSIKPLLGLELTATPFVNIKNKQVSFKNLVYIYSLAEAIKDGYTRTPYAMTRANVSSFEFGDEKIDKLMLQDGISYHEQTKQILQEYSQNEQVKLVKPFVLVVCKDTDHAQNIANYISSTSFFDGIYKDKYLLIHSKKTNSDANEDEKLLKDIESTQSPIEIVIHVNMLKEGWDVNNLYTIIPLRTATSKILREQMVGRGLRLPYAKRVGNKRIDSVMLTAHYNFDRLIEDAQDKNSIFNKEQLIELKDEIEKTKVVFTSPMLAIFDDEQISISNAYEETKLSKTQEHDKFLSHANKSIGKIILKTIRESDVKNSKKDMDLIAKEVIEGFKQHEDFAKIYEKNEDPLKKWTIKTILKEYISTSEKFIPIPRLKTTQTGISEYIFEDFTLDVSELTHTPIENELIIKSLSDPAFRQTLQTSPISLDDFKPQVEIAMLLRQKAEIDYEKCSSLVQKLILRALSHYESKHGKNGMKNIVFMNKDSIVENIYKQMMSKEHFKVQNGLIKEEVISLSGKNLETACRPEAKQDIFEKFDTSIEGTKAITKVLFTSIKKGVFASAKFDSKPELLLARILESDDCVLKWLRPAPKEFNITYNGGKNYEPDFVVETKEHYVLVEVKRHDMLDDGDVLAKSERSMEYCKVASDYCKANGYKEWIYVLIPDDKIQANSTFERLAKDYHLEKI